MTRARHQQISLDDTPYYHCISRCVRRAFLCGDDPVSGQNFDHRKQWLVERIKLLAKHFAIDVCAYAVMSNHYHLVLFVNESKANRLTDQEVIKKWTALFPRNVAIIETLAKNSKSRKAQKHLELQIQQWRDRLKDISWFMRCLNESVARRANKEDECKGRFWEGRFKSQALLDEKSLVTCMTYVDLNPIRAGITDSLDSSDFTSIQERLISQAKKAKKRSYRQHRLLTRRGAKHLLGRQSARTQSSLKAFSDGGKNSAEAHSEGIPFSQAAYFELLESTSKAFHLAQTEPARAVHILEEKQSLLQNLGIPIANWTKSVSDFHKHYGIAAGGESSLVKFHNSRIKSGVDFKHPKKWIRGIKSARLLYGT